MEKRWEPIGFKGMFFFQTEPTPIIIQDPNFSRAQRLQDAEMQLEKIKPSKADCVFRSFRWGDDFPIRKGGLWRGTSYTKVIFFGVSASSTGELELSGLWLGCVEPARCWKMAKSCCATWRTSSDAAGPGRQSWVAFQPRTPRQSRTSFKEVQRTEKRWEKCRV